jgi:hypothetical protein
MAASIEVVASGVTTSFASASNHLTADVVRAGIDYKFD